MSLLSSDKMTFESKRKDIVIHFKFPITDDLLTNPAMVEKVWNLVFNDQLFKAETAEEHLHIGNMYHEMGCGKDHHVQYNPLKYGKDYAELACKHFKAAINIGEIGCAHEHVLRNLYHVAYHLANHYKMVGNYDMMKKYYIMAIETNFCRYAMDELVSFYNHSDISHRADELAFYYKYKSLDDIEFNGFIDNRWMQKGRLRLNQASIEFIAGFDPVKTGLPEDHIFMILHKSLNTHLNLLDLHFKYSPDSDGYAKAKKDFFGLFNSTNSPSGESTTENSPDGETS